MKKAPNSGLQDPDVRVPECIVPENEKQPQKKMDEEGGRSSE